MAPTVVFPDVEIQPDVSSSDDSITPAAPVSSGRRRRRNIRLARLRAERRRDGSLLDVMWRTLVLMQCNQLLQLRVEALKRETSAFVCSVLKNTENRPEN